MSAGLASLFSFGSRAVRLAFLVEGVSAPRASREGQCRSHENPPLSIPAPRKNSPKERQIQAPLRWKSRLPRGSRIGFRRASHATFASVVNSR
jgi:hypothetical protein